MAIARYMAWPFLGLHRYYFSYTLLFENSFAIYFNSEMEGIRKSQGYQW